jgi:hypothetical protein
VKENSDDFNEPYLPERYKEIVRKKKQARILKKIGMIAIAVFTVIVIFILISGFFSGSPQPDPSPTPSPVPAATILPSTTAAITIATPQRTASPVMTGTPVTIITTKPATTAAVTTTETPEPVLTARAGTIITQKTQAPQITGKQAEAIALVAFPNLPAGKMSVELVTDPDFGQVWKFMLRADTTVEASGLIDAETGSVVTFNRTIHSGGRSQNPVITMGNARQIADSTINNRNNGILSINMSDGRYLPLATQSGNVAGTYRFVYKRIIQDYPCDVDGFIVSVDAISGEITEYVQRWQTPDNAFMIIETPVVVRYDAIYTVQAKAKTVYPSSISTLSIISAERCWKDKHDPATTPRPSSIPLVWKIVFTDETIQAKAGAAPAVGWVDTHSGEIIEFTYQH